MKILLILALCFWAAGCATEDQAQSTALGQAVAHCVSEGKQFVYSKTTKAPADAGIITEVTVSGYCATLEQLAKIASKL
jgi:hypothetical protein